jgi:transcriptional regulator with XRE-family HTH domain
MNQNNKTPLQQYGDSVRKARKEAKLTQKQLADKVGITHEWICKIEKGKANAISSSLMESIAKALDMKFGFTVITDDVQEFVESKL